MKNFIVLLFCLFNQCYNQTKIVLQGFIIKLVCYNKYFLKKFFHYLKKFIKNTYQYCNSQFTKNINIIIKLFSTQLNWTSTVARNFSHTILILLIINIVYYFYNFFNVFYFLLYFQLFILNVLWNITLLKFFTIILISIANNSFAWFSKNINLI